MLFWRHFFGENPRFDWLQPNVDPPLIYIIGKLCSKAFTWYFLKIILWILQCVRILMTLTDRFSRWSETPSYKSLTVREGFKKKTWKSVVFCQTGGRGGLRRWWKNQTAFLKQSFFQRVSRIILGPPKHVLPLVWSAYFISTAVRTAFKVARTLKSWGERKQL